LCNDERFKSFVQSNNKLRIKCGLAREYTIENENDEFVLNILKKHLSNNQINEAYFSDKCFYNYRGKMFNAT
jgi:hypothetical protein